LQQEEASKQMCMYRAICTYGCTDHWQEIETEKLITFPSGYTRALLAGRSEILESPAGVTRTSFTAPQALYRQSTAETTT
jgi:hypothetical protein